MHPCYTLTAIEDVIAEIRSNQSYIWKSELQTLLENAVDKQWKPIILDHQIFLQSIGGKLVFLGLIGSVVSFQL
jgi:hypothetical protein